MVSILHGYNVFKGSPYAKSDEGFASRLFTVDWDNTLKDSFGKRRPRDTNVRNIDKCSSSTSVQIATDEADLQEEYSGSVEGSLGGPAYEGFTGGFKGSSDFKHLSKMMSEQKKTTAIATASCIAY
jgi:hypothetical protein